MALLMDDWVRHGECNHCGACCTDLVTDMTVLIAVEQVLRPGPEHEDYFRVRQVPLVEQDGKLYRQYTGKLLNPCQYHQQNQCSIYETRPRFCRDFPTHPDHIKAMPCSYWFQRGEEIVGGQGAPSEIISRYG